MIEERPWGTYEVLLDDAHTKVKKITVKPNQRLSYQDHHKRSEHWVIIDGIATIILNGLKITKHPGDSIFIPVETKYRIINEHAFLNLVFVEVQIGIGTYFGEDDIVRIEDDYNRA